MRAVIITIAVLPLPTKLKQRGMSGRLALLLTILAVVGVINMLAWAEFGTPTAFIVFFWQAKPEM